MTDSATDYARGVLSGEFPAGSLVRAACQRHLDDLKESKKKSFPFEYIPDKGNRAIKFCSLMSHYKGPFKGKPFVPLAWQEFVLGSIFGWVKKSDGTRRFRTALVEIPRKNGKALALDTPIPTPEGWKTMGEIQEGDLVIGDDGLPTRVVGTWDHLKPCYRLKFSNGEEITACEDHLWKTEDSILTTQDIAERLESGVGLDFTCSIKMPCFKTNHHLDQMRLRSDCVVNPQSGLVLIVSCKLTETVPTRCIQVDNESEMFLCGRTMIPTHNTYLGAAVALYMLVADGEGGPEIYSGATKREQAKIVWDDAWAIIKNSPALRKHLDQKYSKIIFDANSGVFLPLSADSRKLDGLNPHCGIIDEYHEHPDSSLYDVIEDGMGARSQPLMFTITTAGNNINSACYELHTHAVNILTNKGYDDPQFFGYVACPDEDDDWRDEETWFKANPSLGEAKLVSYMESKVADAKLRPSREYTVKNKQLNIWTSTEEKWLNMERWDACGGEIDLELLEGHRAFVGMDLSSKYDFTCVSLIFPQGPYKEWAILPRFYYPEEDLEKRERELRVPLREWARQGLIQLTPGDMIDLEFIREDIIRLSGKYQIAEIGFDPWKAIEIATKLEQEGFDMVQMRQGHATLGAPTSGLEEKMMKGQLRHGGNPILRWMAGNTATRPDPNGNIVPDKSKSAQKIDGIAATIMGLGRAMVSVDDGLSVYEERGVLTL